MDIVCFSHLRWHFVYQRPQHLMTGIAREGRVFYIEEAFYEAPADRLDAVLTEDQVYVLQMHLAGNDSRPDVTARQQQLLSSYFATQDLLTYLCWFYTPMALPLLDVFEPQLIVYDCMDELSAFKFAPPLLKKREQELLDIADLVFTGGSSLYQAKKHRHPQVHLFPSSIDKTHFATARTIQKDPADQESIPHPRLGFYGVLDERFDIELIDYIATHRPDWHIVLIGPVVKIDPQLLPRQSNIHYLGAKQYSELPGYLAGWDVAMISFALNESTKFISPTKTPEYLAAGRPVVSTAITDVVNPYGEQGLVRIAHSPAEFTAMAAAEMEVTDKQGWLQQVDLFLANQSWSNTVAAMQQLIQQTANEKQLNKTTKSREGVYV
jgi:hypothetical protein